MKETEEMQIRVKQWSNTSQPCWQAAVVLRTATCWFCARQKWELKVLPSCTREVQQCNWKLNADQWCFLTSPHRNLVAGQPKSSVLLPQLQSGEIHIHCYFRKQGQEDTVTLSFFLRQLEKEQGKTHRVWQAESREHLAHVQILSKVSNKSNPQAHLKNNFTMPKWI